MTGYIQPTRIYNSEIRAVKECVELAEGLLRPLSHHRGQCRFDLAMVDSFSEIRDHPMQRFGKTASRL
jgi:hypothetical protein